MLYYLAAKIQHLFNYTNYIIEILYNFVFLTEVKHAVVTVVGLVIARNGA